MRLTVIIVNYNGAGFLPRCLNSISKHLGALEHEVLVVDNASSDGSVGVVKKDFPWVTTIANEENLGFSAGVNVGLRRAKGEYVLWLNPDSVILDDGIVRILDYLNEHPEVGIVGPKLVDPDGGVQLSCRSFPSFRTALFNRYSLLTRIFPRNRFSHEYLLTSWDHSSLREVDWVSGACLLHRRVMIEQLGVLDERFFMYCEDVDYCLRARREGWAVLYHPGWRVLHYIAGSSRQVRTRMLLERHRSMWRYYKKHFARSLVKDALVSLGISARCGLILARQYLKRKAGRVRIERRADLRSH